MYLPTNILLIGSIIPFHKLGFYVMDRGVTVNIVAVHVFVCSFITLWQIPGQASMALFIFEIVSHCNQA